MIVPFIMFSFYNDGTATVFTLFVAYGCKDINFYR